MIHSILTLSLILRIVILFLLRAILIRLTRFLAEDRKFKVGPAGVSKMFKVVVRQRALLNQCSGDEQVLVYNSATGIFASATYTGGDGAHNNMPPYVALNFIIRFA